MKRTFTYIFLGAMVALFATVFYLLAAALLDQEKDFDKSFKQHKRLVQEADAERQSVEQLIESGREQDRRFREKLEAAQTRIEQLAEEFGHLPDDEQRAPKPDQAEVEKLAALPVAQIASELQKAMDARDRGRTSTLAAALRKNRDEALKHLTQTASNTTDHAQKCGCLRMLSMLRDTQTLPLFQDTLQNETDTEACRIAAAALAAVPDPSSVPVLVSVLRTAADLDLKARAVVALGVIGDARALSPLEQTYLKEKNESLRNFALVALAHIADPGTAGFLSDIAINSQNEGHRLIAVTGLRNIGTPEAVAALAKVALGQTGAAADEARKALEELPGAKDSQKK